MDEPFQQIQLREQADVSLFLTRQGLRMYQHNMIPVDLARNEKSEHALTVVAELAKHYDATATYIAITPGAPSATAPNPKKFAQKPADFAKDQGAYHGHQTATHLPNMADMLLPSHDGKLARHTDASVFRIRDR